MFVRRVAAALLAAWLGVASGGVRADERARSGADAQGSDQYRALVEKGIAEFNRENFQEARAFFLRAHGLYPNARTLRSLGLVAYALRRYVAAVDYMERALRERTRPLTDAMRGELASKLEDARGFITPVKVDTPVVGVRYLVDGQPAVFGSDGRLLLDPGRHELTAQAPGYQRSVWSWLATGEPAELTLQLRREDEPLEAAAQSSAPPQPADRDGDGSDGDSVTPMQIAGISCGAAAVVGVGVGVAFAVLAVEDNQASAPHCERNNCDAIGVRQRDRALERADIATVSFMASGILAATGAALFFVGLASEPTDHAFRLAPASSGRGEVQLSLRGGF